MCGTKKKFSKRRKKARRRKIVKIVSDFKWLELGEKKANSRPTGCMGWRASSQLPATNYREGSTVVGRREWRTSPSDLTPSEWNFSPFAMWKNMEKQEEKRTENGKKKKNRGCQCGGGMKVVENCFSRLRREMKFLRKRVYFGSPNFGLYFGWTFNFFFEKNQCCRKFVSLVESREIWWADKRRKSLFTKEFSFSLLGFLPCFTIANKKRSKHNQNSVPHQISWEGKLVELKICQSIFHRIRCTSFVCWDLSDERLIDCEAARMGKQK